MLSYHIDTVEELLTEYGHTVGADVSGRHVIEAARKYAGLLDGGQKPTQVPINEHISRFEDMGQGCLEVIPGEEGGMTVNVVNDEGEQTRVQFAGTGRLELFREEDGDMIVTAIDGHGQSSTVQFTTYGSGGGQSPKVLKALYELARAILEENEANPQHGRGEALKHR
jgi:hypothetical protein